MPGGNACGQRTLSSLIGWLHSQERSLDNAVLGSKVPSCLVTNPICKQRCPTHLLTTLRALPPGQISHTAGIRTGAPFLSTHTVAWAGHRTVLAASTQFLFLHEEINSCFSFLLMAKPSRPVCWCSTSTQGLLSCQLGLGGNTGDASSRALFSSTPSRKCFSVFSALLRRLCYRTLCYLRPNKLLLISDTVEFADPGTC